ncbi:glycoside hydrolase family 5 protein [Scleroderma citrinum Foug A]|uniref:mannan endo-1,4-beta-mannosidase n=1 Tax=Scleroderma citrinum Foug A TaxID=1036808 RepID=A0A0C3EBB3_9AGAM|nr:glycoside hydrolase family 5 protein [Scleroderma citrinum Foug A]
MKVNRWFSLTTLAALLLPALAIPTSGTKAKRNSSPFVQTDGTSFIVNGSKFRFVGTNAYWLPALNTDDDVWNTLGNISATGAKVVRVWAFNDVDTVPQNGTWFQLVQDGTISINDGPNGLQRLDTVIRMAEQHGLYVILSLTNNWYPLGSAGTSLQTRWHNSPAVILPRNYLSNDYGGMDIYVRQFGLAHHDQFYTNQTLVDAFKNYTTQVVSRFMNCTGVLSWEIANDPRCSSTLPASSDCTTETVTQWHATMADHIRSIDPNHLVSSGTQGFMCIDCPKLYPLTPPPAPQPSPAPGSKKRSAPVSSKQILRKRTESKRLNREAAIRSGTLKKDGIRVRGRWAATATRRQQSQGVGSPYDGSYGVDSQDILNIPSIDFGAFQLFPDQQSYAPSDPSLSTYDNFVSQGVDWITNQAQSASAVGKPFIMTSFGLVTQGNAADFVPFNMTTAPYGSSPSSSALTTEPYGATNQQQTDAYSSWMSTSVSSNVAGMVQYQWGQTNLTAMTGTTISPGITGISPSSDVTGTTPSSDTTGISPNDGYSSTGNNGVQQVMKTTSQNIASD